MGTQHRITTQMDLLDNKGHLIEPGYATKLLWKYDRTKIKAGWHRIKEWDYYYILNEDYGITFTMSDLGYAGMHAVAWLDFQNNTTTQVDTLSILPKGKTNFPSTSTSGNVSFKDKKIDISFEVHDNTRILKISCPNFENKRGEKGLKGELRLLQEPEMDTMVIATSWKDKPKKFYYNQKINCMRAEGTVTIGDHDYKFSPDSSFAGLDWGRGNWTYKNRWYWGSASGELNGELFGWNIGYGFSDRSPASENMIFYKGKAHKLDEVTFEIDTTDYMKPWRFTSNDGRFELNFTPAVDRYSKTNLWLIVSEQHQTFGHFSGHVILDDGTKLEIKDFLGFAEDVLNYW
ncbi:hypothetical protein NEF87_000931 [Candidatus Lokiarchaeum ossiferum]|uniref:DUF2804 domain-containing protein n=1 Tax=Candidatus Lokiarchaeum ossiferum TaxID=2951803 RepID=A0ABY6HMJ9_9ARCH|nr:hypothetical protein NEF87_000931 [Candidatus Lokiarchaeum sp. B-35]